ncbi:MAG: hydrogenase maturation protease [Vicinamibacterales bacterium]
MLIADWKRRHEPATSTGERRSVSTGREPIAPCRKSAISNWQLAISPCVLGCFVARTYVLGLGNVLMGDDGFGPAVVREFVERYEVGPDVEVVDLGTPGLDLTPWLTDTHHVVFVDTVKATLPPGSLRTYDKADLTRHAPFARTGPHDPGVKECVLTLEFAGRAPQHVTIVGAVPSECGMSLDLSAPLSAAVPAAADAVADALARYGDEVHPRSTTSQPASPWWQPVRA